MMSDVDSMRDLREELRGWYGRASATLARPCVADGIEAVWDAMDGYAQRHAGEPACLLKARLHEEIAERFEPVVFPHSPFFFEMGMRVAESWGTPQQLTAGAWTFRRRVAARRASHPAAACLARFGAGHRNWEMGEPGLWLTYGDGFDTDHYSPAYGRLLGEGVEGVLRRIEERGRGETTARQAAFLEAARRSCLAVVRIAGRFAERADAMLAQGGWDAEAVRCLGAISRAARRVPARPPETFYEGLAAMWFLRETMGTIEGIGVSVIGHPDRHLIDLYRRDVAEGRLSESDARDLLARWMLPTDMRFHLDANRWPETSTCLELGGCDARGAAVFNDLTRLAVEVHAEQNLVNPKLNCRIGASSPPEYLDLIARHALAGHNVFALQNDDVLIPALVKSGKSLEDARLYVNGGCQETIVEGVEHSAGAYYYCNLARVLDLSLQPAPGLAERLGADGLGGYLPMPVGGADSFEAFYGAVLGRLTGALALGAGWCRDLSAGWDAIHPCPFYSASTADCVENAMDYSAGGGRYNGSGLGLVGFATVVDSLFAVRSAVYEEQWLSLDGLRVALAANWSGHESCRARLAALGKYGHGDREVDGLASRVARDLASAARGVANERGGNFQPNLFVYYQFVHMGKGVRATPDGRRAGDFLSQGAAPGRVRPSSGLTDIFQSLGFVDFTDFPGNAVVDVQLPLGAMAPEKLSAAFRAFVAMGGATLQPNCVSVGALRDAQIHPETHGDLLVRISGLSARFVALDRSVQDEIIDRALVAV